MLPPSPQAQALLQALPGSQKWVYRAATATCTKCSAFPCLLFLALLLAVLLALFLVLLLVLALVLMLRHAA